MKGIPGQRTQQLSSTERHENPGESLNVEEDPADKLLYHNKWTEKLE
jgi:hypothetical protein